MVCCEKPKNASESSAFAEVKPSRSFRKGATALQVLEGVDLSGKVALVTGANSGLGYETAKALAVHNAQVIMACRDPETAEEARKKILAEKPDGKLDIIKLDLTELSSVEEFVKEFLAKNLPLHILILNAGVYGPTQTVTNDGFETTFQVNHLSQFHLANLLIDKLIESAPARIVVVSSMGHEQAKLSTSNLTWEELSPIRNNSSFSHSGNTYCNSKLCNVWFAKELDRRYREKGILTASLHPGVIGTNIFRNTKLFGIVVSWFKPILVTPEQGAATQTYLATAPELQPSQGGKYFVFCNEKEPSRKALNAEAAQKMWEISEEMIQRFKTSSNATEEIAPAAENIAEATELLPAEEIIAEATQLLPAAGNSIVPQSTGEVTAE